MIKLHGLSPAVRKKRKKRVGRGIAAGQGKTAGRGTKGQKSRSGVGIPRHFEGGQTPLILRIPKKRGFKSKKLKPQIVNLSQIEKKYTSKEKVTPQTLFEKGLISNPFLKVKILGRGELSKKLEFQNILFSKKVQKEIFNIIPKKSLKKLKDKDDRNN